jgi:hypothetical protein
VKPWDLFVAMTLTRCRSLLVLILHVFLTRGFAGDGNADNDDDSVITDDSDDDAEATDVDDQQRPRTPARDITQLTSYRANNNDSSDDTQSPPPQIKARYFFSMGSARAPSTSGFGKPTGTSNINSRTRVVRNLLNPSRLFRGARQPLHMAASTPATVEQEVDTSSRTTNTQATSGKNIVCSSSEVFCPTCQQIVQSSRESNRSLGGIG